MPMETVKPTGRKTCLLVLGMHRSGTSALTGTLGLMGVTLPDLQVRGNESNVKGHFESLTALELNEELLAAMNSCWYDISSLNISHVSPPFLEEWKAKFETYLASEFDRTSLFALKDPRFSRLLQIVVEVLRDLDLSSRAIIAVRHPLEVARSLEIRDGIAPFHGINLWLRYMLDAELNSRGLIRMFSSYSGLLQDWSSTIDRIEDRLGVELPRRPATAATSVNEFLESSLRHSVFDSDEAEKGLSNYGDVIDCYRAMGALIRDPNDHDAMHNLDLIRGRFDQSASLWGGALTRYFSEFQGAQEELSGLNATKPAE